MPPRSPRPKPYGRKSDADEFDPDKTPLPIDTDEAVARLWEIRNVGEKVTKLDIALEGYTAQTDRLQGEVAQWSGAVKECIAATDEASRKLVSVQAELTGFFDREWPRLDRALTKIVESIDDLGKRMTKLETLVQHVGDAQESQAAKLVALESKVQSLELEHRDKRVAVAERKRIFSWARAGVVALAAFAGFVAEHVVSFIAK